MSLVLPVSEIGVGVDADANECVDAGDDAALVVETEHLIAVILAVH